ncbi:MAG: hypothetical protein WBB45_21630 [Cyclobacteriaceae bacterium]
MKKTLKLEKLNVTSFTTVEKKFTSGGLNSGETEYPMCGSINDCGSGNYSYGIVGCPIGTLPNDREALTV